MVFFIFAVSVLSMVISYVWWRLVIPAGLSGPLYISSIIFAIILLALPFVSVFLRFAGHQNILIYCLTWLTFVLLGMVTMLFLFIAARDLLLLTGMLSGKLISVIYGERPLPGVVASMLGLVRNGGLVRMSNLALIIITGFMIAWGLFTASRGPKVEEIEIGINNLGSAFDGFRIVQISDLHAGSTITLKQFKRILTMTQELEGDMIALTGDVADGKPSSLPAYIEALKVLDAPFGKYFVTGNHEYYSGVDKWIAAMKGVGFEVLLNSHQVIEKNDNHLVIAGVSDYEGGHLRHGHDSDPHAALAGAPENTPSILLAHQPLSIHEAEKAGFDLVLSGHTHGGQYLPWNLFVGMQQPYVKGLHMQNGTAIYINRGSGYWGPPLRGGVPGEITVITLRSK